MIPPQINKDAIQSRFLVKYGQASLIRMTPDEDAKSHVINIAARGIAVCWHGYTAREGLGTTRITIHGKAAKTTRGNNNL